MSAIEHLIAFACVAAFLIIAFRLNVRLFHATRGLQWLPLQRSHLSRALFDRQLSNTFVIELVGLVIVVVVITSLLPPFSGGR
jgi:hypothetical protein